MNCEIFTFVTPLYIVVIIALPRFLDRFLPTGNDINPNNPQKFEATRSKIITAITTLLLIPGLLLTVITIDCLIPSTLGAYSDRLPTFFYLF